MHAHPFLVTGRLGGSSVRAVACLLAAFLTACESGPNAHETCDVLATAAADMYVRCSLGTRGQGHGLIVGDRADGTLGPDDGCNQAEDSDPDLAARCEEVLATTCTPESPAVCNEALTFRDEIP